MQHNTSTLLHFTLFHFNAKFMLHLPNDDNNHLKLVARAQTTAMAKFKIGMPLELDVRPYDDDF